MASGLHVNLGVDACSLQFHHLNSAVTRESVSIAFLTATSADSIDELGITDGNGPSGFSKTIPIFVGLFASPTLEVLQQCHFETAQKIFQNYIFEKGL